MQAVFVLDIKGRKLMPTYNPKKVRKLLKTGKAKIFCHKPFTIQLQYEVVPNNQPVELCIDTGSVHVGLSLKSEKHEYVHMQADLPEDEKKHHDNRRILRRTRRDHLRYRPPRFDNRRKGEGWFAPSIQHKIDAQVSLAKRYSKVCQISSAYIEVGKFDTQVLQAVNDGKPVPEGLDYQHGPKYGFDTLKEAIFCRDKYTCQVCGKSPFKNPGTILVRHHTGYWRGDHSDRISNQECLCTGCHIPANHQKGAILWGRKSKSSALPDAAFMNIARWRILDAMKEAFPEVHMTYGAVTKRTRLERNIQKTHANDAYCIGAFHPKHRAQEIHIKKRIRNHRDIEKFHDATYLDSRDGSEKAGKELSCGRTNRREPRDGKKNSRVFRKKKIRKGNRAVRRQRHEIQAGELVIYKKDKKVYRCKGTQNKGKNIQLKSTKRLPIADIQPLLDKDGNKKPILAGQRLQKKGQKQAHLVYAVDESKQEAIMDWPFAVQPSDVVTIKKEYGGWRVVHNSQESPFPG